ncbi:mucin TcMUCII, partial [Trypanosoma cruzi]
MMTTCRLLCALLVIGLCCCPSVYATTTGEDKTEKENVPKVDETEGTGQEMESQSATSPSPGTKKENKGTKPVENMALHTSHTTGTITKTPQSQNTSSNTQDQDGGKSNEQIEHTNTVTANEQKKAAAPTTTTTTTSTTTTTTKAPTTTTTHAPSHLREIDGSLS